MTGPGAWPSGQSRLATMACVHVVPHFGGVHTKMSPGRGSNPAQRRLSNRGAVGAEQGDIDRHGR